MEATRPNTTDYKLLDEFTRYLLTLCPTELNQFYCETCMQRLDMPFECQPSSPYQEDTGTCVHCQLTDDVSNPRINTFLNAHGLLLTRENPFICLVDQPINETEKLLCYLIPEDLTRFLRNDICDTSDPQLSWMRYGRKRFKEIYRDTCLTEQSRDLLQKFFPLCYSAERYAAAPLEEYGHKPVNYYYETSLDELIDLPSQPVEQPIIEPMGLSTFDRIRAFIGRTF